MINYHQLKITYICLNMRVRARARVCVCNTDTFHAVYFNTHSSTFLRSLIENKNDVRFTMVSLGYENNTKPSKFY